MSEEMLIMSVDEEVAGGQYKCTVLVSGEEKQVLIPATALHGIGVNVGENLAGSRNGEIDAQSCSSESVVNDDSEWKTPETKLLLDKYSGYLEKVGPMKRFRTKKVMWDQISTDLDNILNIKKTGVQCANRYKTVLKRKKLATQNNTTSGCSRQLVPFEDEVRAIEAIDDSLQPEVLRGVNNVVINKKPSSSSSTPPLSSSPSSSVSSPSSQNTDKRQSVKELLWELHRLKEEAKERRHQEKMALLREIFKKQ